MIGIFGFSLFLIVCKLVIPHIQIYQTTTWYIFYFFIVFEFACTIWKLSRRNELKLDDLF